MMVCITAVRLCEWCVGDPVVVCGAGCVDTAIAHILRIKVSQTLHFSPLIIPL